MGGRKDTKQKENKGSSQVLIVLEEIQCMGKRKKLGKYKESSSRT